MRRNHLANDGGRPIESNWLLYQKYERVCITTKNYKKETKSLKAAMRDCKTLFTQSSRTFMAALYIILENRCAGVLYKTPFPKF